MIAELDAKDGCRAAQKGYMQKSFLMFVALVTYPAFSQVVSWTAVVINITKNKVVVVADSLASNKNAGAPDYSHCKVATFCREFIFATVGHSGWSNAPGKQPAWENLDLARDAAYSGEHGRCVAGLDDFADQWARHAKNRWDLIDCLPPQKARDIALSQRSHGQFTVGIFMDDNLRAQAKVIRYNSAKLSDPIEIQTTELADCFPCGQLNKSTICTAGSHTPFVQGVCAKREHVDAIKVRTRLTGAAKSTELPVQIVEMVIDASKAMDEPDVGGAVTSLTITRNGSTTWNSNEDKCPEAEAKK